MAAKLTRLTHKIAIRLHLVAESCTICNSHARRPIQKLLDTPSYVERHALGCYLLNTVYICRLPDIITVCETHVV
jgi:hypothetical protein